MTTGATSSDSDLRALIQSRRGAYIDMLRALLAVSAGGEEALQAEVARQFAELGCQVESIRSRPNQFQLEADFGAEDASQAAERVSVVALRPGRGDGRDLLLFAHPDSEPVTDASDWQHDPFAGDIEGGRIYGWGIADDLSGVAAMICALDALESAGLSLSGDVICASTVSKGRGQGIYAVLDKGYHADGGVYLHPAESGAGFGDIKSSSSGYMKFQITVHGQPPETAEPTHTPFYHLAQDPIEKAWLVYRALTELAAERAAQVHHPAYGEIGRSTNLHIAHIEAGDAARPGRVPDRAVMTGAVTFPPDESLADVRRAIEAAVHDANSSDPWLREHPAELVWLQGTSGVEVPESSPIFQTVAAAIQSATGELPSVQSCMREVTFARPSTSAAYQRWALVHWRAAMCKAAATMNGSASTTSSTWWRWSRGSWPIGVASDTFWVIRISLDCDAERRTIDRSDCFTRKYRLRKG